jgi:hypothetical protein
MTRRKQAVRRARMIVLLFISMAGMTALAPTGAAQSTHYLVVSRTAGAAISDDQANEILREASFLLRMRDAPNDVAAPLSLCLEGYTSASPTDPCPRASQARDTDLRGSAVRSIQGPSLMATGKDFEALAKTVGYVKVVKEISWCGSQRPVGPGDIIGCFVPGFRYFAVMRPMARSTRYEGVLWAHEYAHSKGAPHRQAPDALMNLRIEELNRVLNTKECALLLAPHGSEDADARSISRPYSCH